MEGNNITIPIRTSFVWVPSGDPVFLHDKDTVANLPLMLTAIWNVTTKINSKIKYELWKSSKLKNIVSWIMTKGNEWGKNAEWKDLVCLFFLFSYACYALLLACVLMCHKLSIPQNSKQVGMFGVIFVIVKRMKPIIVWTIVGFVNCYARVFANGFLLMNSNFCFWLKTIVVKTRYWSSCE